jgi:large subunit ribosomal protein L22
MKAILSNYRQSPRKVRLVADLIKGKKVKDADTQLNYLVKRASLPIKKLLNSAVANAVLQTGAQPEDLVVKNVTVDKGTVLKRFMPRAFGRASRINRRTSNVTLTLTQAEKVTKKK